MKLIDYLRENRGMAVLLSKELDVAPAYLSQMATGARPVQPSLVRAIRLFTADAVREWDLRPTDWHLIWPELIGTDGAPEVPAGARAVA